MKCFWLGFWLLLQSWFWLLLLLFLCKLKSGNNHLVGMCAHSLWPDVSLIFKIQDDNDEKWHCWGNDCAITVKSHLFLCKLDIDSVLLHSSLTWAWTPPLSIAFYCEPPRLGLAAVGLHVTTTSSSSLAEGCVNVRLWCTSDIRCHNSALLLEVWPFTSWWEGRTDNGMVFQAWFMD